MGRPKGSKNKIPGKPPWLANFGYDHLTAEQRLEYQRRSKENKGKKATFKAALEMLLDMPVLEGNPVGDALRPIFPDLTNRDAVSIAMIAKAISEGDVKAFQAVRDTMGELPVQTVNVKSDDNFVIKVETVENNNG